MDVGIQQPSAQATASGKRHRQVGCRQACVHATPCARVRLPRIDSWCCEVSAVSRRPRRLACFAYLQWWTSLHLLSPMSLRQCVEHAQAQASSAALLRC